MRNKFLSLLLCVALLCPLILSNHAGALSAADAEDIFSGVAGYKEASCGASSVQEWIDGGLSDTAGTVAEFYIITLSQSGDYDLSGYERALLAYLDSHEVYSPVTREKYALALVACGSRNSYIQDVCDADIGGLGMMSLVFGLHLLNNGCTSALYTTDSLIAAILSARFEDGGWAVTGSAGDVDVTAMVIQALAPYYGTRSDVTDAVNGALNLLSARQLDSGGFKTMGKENCESAAQVLTALASLGIDPDTDSRFIHSGNTVWDAVLGYRNADGSFSHTGSGYSESATTQVFYASRAALRARYGQSPLYILDRSAYASHISPDSTSPAPTQKSTLSSAAERPPQEPSQLRQTHSADPTSGEKLYPTEPPRGEYLAPTGSAIFQPTGAAETTTPDEAPSSGGGYKPFVIAGILIAAAGVCLILLLRGRRKYKHWLPVLLIAGAAIAVVLLTNFESKEAYARIEDKPDPAGSVTLTISCGVLADEEDVPFSVPDDRVILPETTFTIGRGETVYDILLEASKRYDIHIDNRGSDYAAYIAGIAYLYEFEYGELSGWMYRVNGSFPDVGCQAYRLSDGDRIEWLYTRDIGKDLP